MISLCPLSLANSSQTNNSTHHNTMQGKKGEEPQWSDPFEATEKAVLDIIAAWSKGTFTVSRVVYSDNEALCIAIENAIWHEAERLKASMDNIKSDVSNQILWLSDMESGLKSMMTMLIEKRHSKELACIARLLEMIGETIEKAEPIRELWLVAADAISVHPASLVVSPEQEPPIPTVSRVFNDRLNHEQIEVLSQLVADITTGSIVLNEDCSSLLYRCLSPIGPTTVVCLSDTAVMSSLTLPSDYRSASQLIRDKLIRHEPKVGVDDHYGVLDASTIVASLGRV